MRRCHAVEGGEDRTGMALAETVVAIRVAVWPTIPVIGEGVTGCGRRARLEVGDAPEVDVDMGRSAYACCGGMAEGC